MVIKVNQSKDSTNIKEASNEIFRHIRTNPETGQTDYYYPLEITDSSIRALAKERGLEIGRSRLGFRIFDAVMIPCRNTVMIHDMDVFVDTPSNIQRRIYKALCKDELDEQEAIKEDGRCNIPDERGGTKRCPLRISNPEYTPENGMPRTLPVKCKGCKYEPFKSAHTVVEISCLDSESDTGEATAYGAPSPQYYYATDRYEELADEFVAYIKAHKPRLTPIAEKLAQEYSLTDASEELGKSISTTFSQKEKLKERVTEFLDTIITM